ncbi:FMN-binding negative transcriptional regulator [Nonomuraea sp. NPDC050790]|uniref:FMN-binding negative transcriptional regulator n=1 Tax=Nonomuraea sp. NPDC050790 TaxID=3364371 RepID=UPI003794428C
MYIDPAYADAGLDEVRRLVADWPFATVIAASPDLRVAHVPVQMRQDPVGLDELVGHVSAADPIARSLRCGAEVLVCFLGPAVYVSPGWYADKGLPTYNFTAVHVRGTATPLDDPAAVRAHLMSLVQDHERGRAEPWRADGWARARTTELLGGLQAFTVAIDSIEAKVKMSQNRTPGDRVGVMDALSERDDPGARTSLWLMSERFDRTGRNRKEVHDRGGA